MRNAIKRTVSALLAVMTTAALTVTTFALGYDDDPGFAGSTPVTSSSTAAVTTEVIEAGTVEVASLASVSVPYASIKNLAKAGGTLTIVSKQATITIDSSTIKKSRKIDLSMKVYGSTSRSVIDMRSRKDFGCDVQIVVTNCKMSAAKLAAAHVYCDDDDLGPVELNDAGQPVITVKKGGKYIIK